MIRYEISCVCFVNLYDIVCDCFVNCYYIFMIVYDNFVIFMFYEQCNFWKIENVEKIEKMNILKIGKNENGEKFETSKPKSYFLDFLFAEKECTGFF